MQQSKFRTHSLACSHRLLWPLAKTNSNLFTGFLLGYLRLPGNKSLDCSNCTGSFTSHLARLVNWWVTSAKKTAWGTGEHVHCIDECFCGWCLGEQITGFRETARQGPNTSLCHTLMKMLRFFTFQSLLRRNCHTCISQGRCHRCRGNSASMIMAPFAWKKLEESGWIGMNLWEKISCEQ